MRWFVGLAAIIGLAVFVVFAMQPKSIAALEVMTSEERLAYLQNRETSDVVSYYCGDDLLPRAVERDIEKSLRDGHGVSRCAGADGVSRIVPEAARD